MTDTSGLAWHVRVREIVEDPGYGMLRMGLERTFTFTYDESVEALKCYREASENGFEVEVRQVRRVKEYV